MKLDRGFYGDLVWVLDSVDAPADVGVLRAVDPELVAEVRARWPYRWNE